MTLGSQPQPAVLHEPSGVLFSYAVNECPEQDWPTVLDGFRDANLFQTLEFSSLKSPRGRVERFVLSRGSAPVAAAAVRVTSLPWPAADSAYVRWGPLWRQWDAPPDFEVWRQAIRALRAEYVVRRKMWLRILPMLTEGDDPALLAILKEEGFHTVALAARQRTMLIDLAVPIDQLRKGIDSKWRNQLVNGERNNLEIIEGVEDALIEQFLVPFEEMISRKGISEPGDISSFRAIQRVLPERHKVRVFLARSEGDVCAGAIASHLGDRGIYHFGATATKGMRTKASYVLQWRIIEWLKERGCATYDLHGVNRSDNPGVYSFKAGLCSRNGKEVAFLGAFDACGCSRARFTARAATLFQQRRRILMNVRARLRPTAEPSTGTPAR